MLQKALGEQVLMVRELLVEASNIEEHAAITQQAGDAWATSDEAAESGRKKAGGGGAVDALSGVDDGSSAGDVGSIQHGVRQHSVTASGFAQEPQQSGRKLVFVHFYVSASWYQGTSAHRIPG